MTAVTSSVTLALLLGMGVGILVLNGFLDAGVDGMKGPSAGCEEAGNCVSEGVITSLFVLISNLLQFLWIIVPCSVAAVVLLVLGVRHIMKAYKKPAVSTGKMTEDVDMSGLALIGGGVTLLGPAFTLLLLFFTPEIIFQ